MTSNNELRKKTVHFVDLRDEENEEKKILLANRRTANVWIIFLC